MVLGTTEWLIIAGAAVLLFGAPKVVEWARSIGKAHREFNKAKNGEDEDAVPRPIAAQ